jgi:hypothetical protein
MVYATAMLHGEAIVYRVNAVMVHAAVVCGLNAIFSTDGNEPCLRVGLESLES